VFFSRRRFLQASGASLLFSRARRLSSQAPLALPVAPMVKEFPGISQVSIVQGDDRRKNVRAALGAVRKKYRLHPDIDRELQWMGPMEDIPLKLGLRWKGESKIFE